MTGNFDINKELLDAMRIIARQEIERCNRDITKTARVINVNNDKTVKIEMDGKQYDNIPNYNGTTLSVNNIVKVTYPQGQASNMYVSGGGEDEIYSNLVKVIEYGSILFSNLKPNTFADNDIKFKKSFSSPPLVFVSNGSKSKSIKYGSMSISAINISTTGFTIRFYNNTDYTPQPYIMWTAIL